MKWKMFLRNNGRYSLAHLCNDANETVCGWKYGADEYTKTVFVSTIQKIELM